MLVKSINRQTYKKLVDYAIKNCSVISLKKYLDQHERNHNRVLNIIVSDNKYIKKYICENYSKKLLLKLYSKYKNDERIYSVKEYINEIEKHYRKLNIYTDDEIKEILEQTYSCLYDEKTKKFNVKSVINSSIGYFIYDNICEETLKKYKSSFLKCIDLLNDSTMKKNPNQETYMLEYFFKLDQYTKKILISKSSIFDYKFPTSLENLCLYKNNHCWLWSVAHERLCEIYCENEEEFNYLKSIGVKFYKNKFEKETSFLEKYDID